MMLISRNVLFAVSILCSCTAYGVSASGAETKSAKGQKHVRVLAIGNSFTGNATRHLPKLVEAAGHKLTLKRLTIGGSSLERHAGMAMAFERDRGDPSAKYSGGESLQEALQSEPWDFVTIQQLSMKSHDASTYRPYANQLADVVHRYAPQSQLLVHQTWAYRSDDPRFGGGGKAGEPRTQKEMYLQVSEAYRQLTGELAAKRIPVGDAFWLAETDEVHGFQGIDDFDLGLAKHPRLPPQPNSLHVGYRWKTTAGKQSIAMDGHHANTAGEYLGGCVWLECLFGVDCQGNPFAPAGLQPEYVKFLQSTAHEAVDSQVTARAGDVIAGKTVEPKLAFDDPAPKRYQLKVRASQIDSRVKEYPEIGFVFGSDDKPADTEFASIDTRVAPQGKLAIWLMGYNSGLFERLNQNGIHAIGVSYARQWFGKLCRPSPADAYARGRVRLEAATGQDFSDELELLPPDGMAERARMMLIWLVKENPQGRWEQFLTEDRSRVRWDKVIITGSSHGSTTAARFAKHQRVDRVVMLCGPRDQDQDWQGLPSATPANRFFGFTHVLDGGWTGDHYCRSWQMLGLHNYGPIVNVDEAKPPYQNTRRLISAADVGGDAGRAHSSVTPGSRSPKNSAGDLLYDPVWHYLFNHAVQEVGEPVAMDPDCLQVHAIYK